MTQHTDATADPPVDGIHGTEPAQSRALTEFQLAQIYTSLPSALVAYGATPDQADEFTQQAIIATVNRAVDMTKEKLTNPGGYAYRVGRNLLSREREKARKELLAEDASTWRALWSEAADLDLPLERSQLLAELIKIMAEYLTPRQQEAFHYVYRAGLTIEQAAEAMRIDPETVRTHLYRGAKQLVRYRPELRERLGL